jgi:hypothetical protein
MDQIKGISMKNSLIIDQDGTKRYYLNDQLHREDGPAVESANGTKEWYINGLRHREDGPAYEEINGSKGWYINGKRHRLDGPAFINANGDKEYWQNGNRHRMDGPAYDGIVRDGFSYKEYRINNVKYSQQEYEKIIKFKAFL